MYQCKIEDMYKPDFYHLQTNSVLWSVPECVSQSAEPSLIFACEQLSLYHDPVTSFKFTCTCRTSASGGFRSCLDLTWTLQCFSKAKESGVRVPEDFKNMQGVQYPKKVANHCLTKSSLDWTDAKRCISWQIKGFSETKNRWPEHPLSFSESCWLCAFKTVMLKSARVFKNK